VWEKNEAKSNIAYAGHPSESKRKWKIDNSHFSTSFNYFDGHASGNSNIIRPIDSFFKLIKQYEPLKSTKR
jgi:hypothetical protein